MTAQRTPNYRSYRPGFALLPSRCCLCGRKDSGLWCDRCLVPYVAAGEAYAREPDANTITVRYRNTRGDGK